MDLAARRFSDEVDPEVTAADIHEAAKAALDSGCDDPYLVYLHTRTLVGADAPGPEEAGRRAKASAAALAAGRYPAFRRAIAHEIAGGAALSVKAPDDASRKEAERSFDAALA